MSDTTIDDLLVKLAENYYQEKEHGKHTENYPDPNIAILDEAKSALYELMLSVIGEDDWIDNCPDDCTISEHDRIDMRNDLRESMRNKLKELMK